MTGAGLLPTDRCCCVVLGRHGAPARPLHGGGLRRAAPTARRPGDRFFAPDRAGDLPLPARRPASASSAGTSTPSRCSRSASCRSCSSTCCSAFQGTLPFNPTNMVGVAAVRRVQRRRQLHDQHELAVVLRRAHDEPPHPDARPDGAELRVGRCRHGGRRGDHPRHHPPRSAHARQLLGRPHPHDAARSCCRCRSSSPSLLSLGGVVQNFTGSTEATPLDPAVAAEASQSIPGGPVASQIAIKQLGTNGGGFFNTNSAHPFENPTASPTSSRSGRSSSSRSRSSSCTAAGRLEAPGPRAAGRDGRRSGSPSRVLAMVAESGGNPNLTALGVDQGTSTQLVGGNMEGKEVRFGPASCGLWAGVDDRHVERLRELHARQLHADRRDDADAAHDARRGQPGRRRRRADGHPDLRPAGRVHRRPDGRAHPGVPRQEDPGRRDEARRALHHRHAAGVARRSPPLRWCSTRRRRRSSTPGAHGLSEVLYNFASVANNNGSAFAGQGTGTDWYTITLGLAMLIGRFFLIIPALAIGGSLVRKQQVPGDGRHVPDRLARCSAASSSGPSSSSPA